MINNNDVYTLIYMFLTIYLPTIGVSHTFNYKCTRGESCFCKNGQISMVWFDGISNIVGYLMPNPVYTHILDIYKWLQVFLSNTNSSIKHQSFVYS